VEYLKESGRRWAGKKASMRLTFAGLLTGKHEERTECTTGNAIPIWVAPDCTVLIALNRYSPFGEVGGVSFLTRKQ
jgi:hypothetical protein